MRRNRKSVYMAGKTHGEWMQGYYTVRLKEMGRMEDEPITWLTEVFNRFLKIETKIFRRWEDALAHYKHWTEEKLPVQIALEAFRQAEPLGTIIDGQHRSVSYHLQG